MDNQNKQASPKSTLRKYLVMAGKLLLALGIVAWLVIDNHKSFRQGLKVFNYYWLIPAFLSYFAHMFFSGWRWYKLAKMLNINMSMSEAVTVTFQSYFWSLVIPGGAIGGDVARVAIISKRQPAGSKVEGILTVLIDRIVGMVALFSLALFLIGISIPKLMSVKGVNNITFSHDFKVLIIVGLIVLCLSGIVAMLALFFHKQLCKIKLFDRLYKFGDRYSHGTVTRLADAIDLYAENWKSLIFLTLVSVFMIHIMTFVSVLFLIYGLDINPIPKLDVLTAVTIGNIVGLIPLTLSGIGPRDVVILSILETSGMVGNIVIVPVMYSLLIVVSNIICGLFFVFDRAPKKIELQDNE